MIRISSLTRTVTGPETHQRQLGFNGIPAWNTIPDLRCVKVVGPASGLLRLLFSYS